MRAAQVYGTCLQSVLNNKEYGDPGQTCNKIGQHSVVLKLKKMTQLPPVVAK